MAQTNITAQATTATIPVESASTTKTPANPTTIPPAKQKKSPEINNLNLLFNSKKLIELNKTISEN
ncbi:hypothetical protein HOG21_04490 [bacterium]|jgi:hypothetical protein|nr:hypothetical protein [bacterium]